MRLNGAALVLAVLLCLAVPLALVFMGIAWPGNSYFEPAILRQRVTCAGGQQPILDQVGVDALGAAWKTAGEDPLFNRPAKRGGKVYRFTWLRAQHPPIIVRMDEASNGAIGITAIQLNGRGGYPPWQVDRRITRPLRPDEANRFKASLAAASVFNQQSGTCGNGSDGATWTWEVADGVQYRFLHRRSPEAGALRSLGLEFLGLTGWGSAPVY